MHNKKAGVAIEELSGLLTFMFVAVLAILFFSFVQFISAKQTTTETKDYQETLDANEALLHFLKTPVKSDLGGNMADFISQSYINGDYGKLEISVKDFFDNIYGATDLPWDFTIIDSSDEEVFNIKSKASVYTPGGKSLSIFTITPIYSIGGVKHLKISLTLGENTPLSYYP